MRVKCLAQEHNTTTRPGLEPGPLDPESNALTTRPPRFPHSIVYDHYAITNLLSISRKKTKIMQLTDSTPPIQLENETPRGDLNRVLGSCVLFAPLDRCIGRYIDRHSTDMSVAISTDTRPIYRPRYDGRYVGRFVD